jgi:D-glycero-D-manno-heptose 1,7-bisphosphate phosphatase
VAVSERTGVGGRTVVFVDKDGTLIEDLPYNVRPERVRFAPGAREAVRLLGLAGLPIVIVTNQSGVARGYFEWRDLDVLGRFLGEEIRALGGTMLGFYACPHLPDGTVEAYALDCDCRKPLPGLIRQAAAEIGADTAASWFVGDTWMDVAAGQAAGCRAALVGPEHRDRSTHPPGIQPDLAVPTLLDAARVIVEERAARSAAHLAVASR